MQNILASFSDGALKVVGVLKDVLDPLVGLLIAVSALVIVASSLFSAWEQLRSIHQDREVMAGVVLGLDVLIAGTVLACVKDYSPLNSLYVALVLAVLVGTKLAIARKAK